MALTNGQDQSTEFQRAQVRQELEPRRAQMPRVLGETETAARPGPRFAGSESLQRLKRHSPGVFDVQSAWNLGAEPRTLIPTLKQRLVEPSAVIDIGGIDSTPLLVRSGQKPTGLVEGYKNICERWSLDLLGMTKLLHLEEEIGLCHLVLSGQVPPMTGDLKDRMALVIGISVGLGELFDDDKDGELQWLNSTRADLGGASPLEHMLKGDFLNIWDVVDRVDNARGLK